MDKPLHPQPSPEQMQRLLADIQSANELMDVWRRKTGKVVIDLTDRYMKARCKRFEHKGGYFLGDVIKFVCAVVATVIGQLVETIQKDKHWTDDQATEFRAMFDGLLDDYLGKVLDMPHLTTQAVLELGAKRQAEQEEALAQEQEAAKNREESAKARQEQIDAAQGSEAQEAVPEAQEAVPEAQEATPQGTEEASETPTP